MDNNATTMEVKLNKQVGLSGVSQKYCINWIIAIFTHSPCSQMRKSNWTIDW